MAESNVEGYASRLQHIRDTEYPMLKDAIYLDHAGKPPPARSLIQRFSQDMISSLYGNPHANSSSSQLSTGAIELSRLEALKLFNANPAEFDLVFVANATAGVKLVVDCFRASDAGFWFGYHNDSHTSLVGAREAATAGSRCFEDDHEVDQWLGCSETNKAALMGTGRLNISEVHQSSTPVPPNMSLELFGWPAQSNMTGRRLPLHWAEQARVSANSRRYTLLDAAALVSTSLLDLSNVDEAPDFTVLSFYKMFGFPEIGALVVRKAAAHVLSSRQYFGGGTVDLVSCLQEQWHLHKTSSTHVALEDGTLPIHNIVALRTAIQVHKELYGSFAAIQRHTSSLARQLLIDLQTLRHGNGNPVCEVYAAGSDAGSHGPIVAFNIRNSSGDFTSCTEVDRLASLRNIHIRAGGLCNPGGVAEALQLTSADLKRHLSAGHRCGTENDIIDGKALGVLRVSIGAMTSQADIASFVTFVQDVFVEPSTAPEDVLQSGANALPLPLQVQVQVEQIVIYPIKSCGGYVVPSGANWPVRREGLAWDREWCIVKAGTGDLITQKRCPKLVLIQPILDFRSGLMRIYFRQPNNNHKDMGSSSVEIGSVSLSWDASAYRGSSEINPQEIHSSDRRIYQSVKLSTTLSECLGVDCQLARFTSLGKHSKDGSPNPASIVTAEDSPGKRQTTSNESPILAITKQSLYSLNRHLTERSLFSTAISADVFRPNLILSSPAEPYDEEHWQHLHPTNTTSTGRAEFRVLGPCHRCQVVCTDPRTGERSTKAEPLLTLTKEGRKRGSGPFFGIHLLPLVQDHATICVNDTLQAT